MMISSCRIFTISTILILLIAQVDGGHWICDWVNGRGWMYCSRGFCNTFGRKRSILVNDEKPGPMQNNDGIYCSHGKFCYTCEPNNNDACRITQQAQYSPTSDSYTHNKRSDEDVCS